MSRLDEARERENQYQSVLIPRHTLRLVGVGIRETLDLTSFPPEESMQLRADLVALAGLEGVALCTSCLEEGSTLLCVACWKCC